MRQPRENSSLDSTLVNMENKRSLGKLGGAFRPSWSDSEACDAECITHVLPAQPPANSKSD
jgi:hypothetical protein